MERAYVTDAAARIKRRRRADMSLGTYSEGHWHGSYAFISEITKKIENWGFLPVLFQKMMEEYNIIL